MGAQQGKERERTAANTGSLHSLTLASTTPTGSRPVKTKTNSLRPARDTSSSASRSQAFNVFVEHNGKFTCGFLFTATVYCTDSTVIPQNLTDKQAQPDLNQPWLCKAQQKVGPIISSFFFFS